jgi:hypothetical protein
VRSEARVCPRCGSEACEHEYCHTCGLHLFAQPELPTRQKWEEGQSERRDEHLDGAGKATLGGWWNRRPTWQRFAMLLAPILIVVMIAAIASGGGDKSTRGSGGDAGEPAVDSGPPPEQRCVDLFNDPSSPGPGLIESLQSSADVYVAVGFAASFPDKCLVDVYAPNLDVAFEYLEGGPGGRGFTWNEIDASNPPPFNAIAGSDGRIRLK